MQTQSRFTQISALALGIAAAFAFGQADAAGFQLKENSVKAMGRAFAGSAAAPGDASVVTNNPAAMTQFDKNTVQADISVVDLSATFSGGGTDATGVLPLTGGDGGDAGDVTPIPAFSAIFPLGDSGVTVGAMVSAPFGLKTEYENGWVGRYNALKSDVKTVDFTLSASVDITDRFSVGVGMIYERAEATLSSAIDFGAFMAGAGVPGILPQSQDGMVSVEGDDNGFGWLAGAHWRPTDKLTIGYSHRSEIDHDLEGTGDFTLPAAFAGAQAGFAAAAASPNLPLTPAQRAQLAVLGNGFRDTGVVAPLTTPSIDTLSVTYAFTDRFTLLADVSKTDWHSLQAVTVDFANPFQPTSVEAFNWDDTMFYSLGAEFALSDTFALRAGVARDETPTNDEARTPRLPDANRDWVSVGLTWNASEALEVNAGYTHIFVDDPTINGIHSSSNSTLTGVYDADVNLYGVSAQYRF